MIPPVASSRSPEFDPLDPSWLSGAVLLGPASERLVTAHGKSRDISDQRLAALSLYNEALSKIMRPAISAAFEEGTYLDLSPQRVWLRLIDGRVAAASLTHEAPPPSDGILGWFRSLVNGPIQKIVRTASHVHGIDPNVLWGDVAAHLAIALRTCSWQQRSPRVAIETLERCLPLMPAHLCTPDLIHIDGEPWLVVRRHTCCQIYLTTNSYCASCSHLDYPTQDERLTVQIKKWKEDHPCGK